MNTKSGSKVERVMDTYDLEVTGEELEEMWTEEQHSVRELAKIINAGICNSYLRENDIVLDRHIVEDLTAKLMDDDAVLTKYDFESRGVDVDSVRSDFVSYQTVHNYLTGVRGAELKEERRSPSEFVSAVYSLRGRVDTVASQAISRLRARGRVASPEPIVDVDIGAKCPECRSRSDIAIWIQRGSCPHCDHGAD